MMYDLCCMLFLLCSPPRFQVNTLVWKCLGYRFDEQNEVWTSEKVFPKWVEKFPDPPDLIGMRREYTKEIDKPSLKSNQALVKSVPVDNKQSLKTHLRPLGFTGYKVSCAVKYLKLYLAKLYHSSLTHTQILCD